jgi:hypothetical protein
MSLADDRARVCARSCLFDRVQPSLKFPARPLSSKAARECGSEGADFIARAERNAEPRKAQGQEVKVRTPSFAVRPNSLCRWPRDPVDSYLFSILGYSQSDLLKRTSSSRMEYRCIAILCLVADDRDVCEQVRLLAV